MNAFDECCDGQHGQKIAVTETSLAAQAKDVADTKATVGALDNTCKAQAKEIATLKQKVIQLENQFKALDAKVNPPQESK